MSREPQENHGVTASLVVADLSKPEDIARVEKRIGETPTLWEETGHPMWAGRGRLKNQGQP